MPGDDKLSFQIVGAQSATGIYLIVARGRDHRLLADPVIGPLSTACEVLTCTVQEQENFSAAAAWRNGRRVWSVSYEGDEEGRDVVASGDLPLSFPAIRDRFTALATAEDSGDALVDPLYEVAIETVHDQIGYKPGASSPAFAGRYMILEGLDTPWLKRMLFGG